MSGNRLLWNEDDETLDEIVYHGYVHVEQMDDDHYWMGVGDSHFDFVAVKRGMLRLTGHEIHGKDFPLEQRHKTQAEVDRDGYEPAYVTIRDDRPEQERIDDRATMLAARDGKGWRQLTGWQRDKYRRAARSEAPA